MIDIFLSNLIIFSLAISFEHAVVNMFVIPAGTLLGVEVTWQDWWMTNHLPATLGNIIGGFILLHWRCTSRMAEKKR